MFYFPLFDMRGSDTLAPCINQFAKAFSVLIEAEPVFTSLENAIARRPLLACGGLVEDARPR
jgi:hypothetical protein